MFPVFDVFFDPVFHEKCLSRCFSILLMEHSGKLQDILYHMHAVFILNIDCCGFWNTSTLSVHTSTKGNFPDP